MTIHRCYYCSAKMNSGQYEMKKFSPTYILISSLMVFGLMTGCGSYSPDIEQRSDQEVDDDKWQDFSKRETIFGTGGLSLFGSGEPSNEGGSLGVNSFLWRASLDTIVFMPVSSADPFGGVIITDWHTPAETPRERFKLNIYILGKTLRADGIRVAAFRQVLDQNGSWKDAQLPKKAGTQIEDAILTRARQIRNGTLQQNKN